MPLLCKCSSNTSSIKAEVVMFELHAYFSGIFLNFFTIQKHKHGQNVSENDAIDFCKSQYTIIKDV